MEEKSYYQQSASVLVRMKRFQKAVIAFRRNINIPERGLSYDQRAPWYQGQFYAADISASEMKRTFYLGFDQELLPPNRAFVTALKKFASDFNLDEQWYQSLFPYLLNDDGKLDPPFGEPGIDVQVNDSRLPEKELRVTSLKIVLHKDTSITDVEKLMKKAKRWQKMMNNGRTLRKKPWDSENFAKYLKIRDSEEAGMKQKCIAQELGFSTFLELASFKREIEKRFKPSK